MTVPEPKPTLLASMGVSGGVVPSEPSPSDTESPPEPRPARRRTPRRPSNSVRASAAPDTAATDGPTSTLQDSLARVQQRHRERRSSGVRMPLAPLNVDIPLDLLDHVRQVSQDVPYPLRRLAEEAIELWLEATGHQRSDE